jgi:hypothetical protein
MIQAVGLKISAELGYQSAGAISRSSADNRNGKSGSLARIAV